MAVEHTHADFPENLRQFTVLPLRMSLTASSLDCRIRASARLAFAGYAVDIPVTVKDLQVRPIRSN